MKDGLSKICLLIDSLKAGGKERVLSELAGYFSNRPGLEVHLIIYGNYTLEFYPVPDGVIKHIPSFEYPGKSRLWYGIRSLIFLRREVRRIHPDSVLSFGEVWNSYALLALLGLGYPVYISDRCQPDRKYKSVQTFLRRWLYPKARGIIAQTTIAKQIFREQFRHQNIKVIGNPIREIERSGAIEARRPAVLTVGRLIPGKNHRMLIGLFHEIDMPDWQLLIVGGDLHHQPMYEELQTLIKELGEEERILLLGEQEDVNRYYTNSDIFAFMSDSEGFPNVIGEAQSAGLPAVAFDCVAGPSDLIADGENGYLVPLYDTELFRERLQSLMASEQLRKQLGGRARQSIKEFSVDRIGRAYLSFIIEDLSDLG